MYKLLVVDDEDDIRKGIVESNDWNRWGYTVIAEADCGESAVERIEEFQPDVVLSDIRMPGMDGVELMQWIRKNHPDIMVVVLSGYSDFSYLDMSIKNNVAAYILKPTDLNEFEKVFLDLKNKLDEKKEEQLEKEKNRQSIIQNIQLAKESILSQLFSSQIPEPSVLREELVKAELPANLVGGRVVVICVHCTFRYFEKVSSGQKHKNKEMIIRRMNEKNNTDKNWEGIFFINKQEIISGIVKGQDDLLKSFFSKMKREFFQKNGILVNIGVSSPQMKWEDLFFGYTEARNDLDGYGAGAPLLKNISRKDAKIDWPSERLMTAAFLERKKDVLKEIEENFFRIYSGVYFSNFGDMDFIFMTYIHIIISSAEKAGLHLSSLSSKLNVKQDDLYMLESFSAKRVFVSYLTEKIFEELNQMRFSGTKERLVYNVIAIIEKEYCSDQLSLNQVAERMEKSPGYISKAFKEVTGNSFLDYIRDCRMQKAISLLESAQMKIYEIAQAVGYADSTTFFRTFKAYTGVSPADWVNKHS